MQSTLNLSSGTVSALKHLARTNIDSAKGFETAAGQVENPQIASLFRTISAERAKNAEALGEYVELNDADAPESGSVKAALHRWWIDIRAKVTTATEYNVLAEAERGEDYIKHAYEAALKDNTHAAVVNVLQAQYAGVKAGHDKIRDMRDARKPAK